MKIAVTSQNFKSVTGHAGKTRRFIVFDVASSVDDVPATRLDLPAGMCVHEFSGGPHPLDGLDVILTASAGQRFVATMAERGVRVVICRDRDPRKAARNYLLGSAEVQSNVTSQPVVRESRGGGSDHRCCGGRTPGRQVVAILCADISGNANMLSSGVPHNP